MFSHLPCNLLLCCNIYFHTIKTDFPTLTHVKNTYGYQNAYNHMSGLCISKYIQTYVWTKNIIRDKIKKNKLMAYKQLEKHFFHNKEWDQTKRKPSLNSLLGHLVLYHSSLSTAIAIELSACLPVVLFTNKLIQGMHKAVRYSSVWKQILWTFEDPALLEAFCIHLHADTLKLSSEPHVHS